MAHSLEAPDSIMSKAPTTRPPRRVLRWFVVVGLAVLGAATLSACEGSDIHINPVCNMDWTGASNNLWSDPTNWSPANVPSATDTVCSDASASIVVDTTTAVASDATLQGSISIPSGTELHLDGGLVSSMQNLDLAGTLSGDSFVLLSGNNHLAGSITGGTKMIGYSQNATITTGLDLGRPGGTAVLLNAGNLDWSGGNINVCGDSGINTDGTLNATASSSVSSGCPGTQYFLNTGTFAVNSSSVDMNIPFDNDNTVTTTAGSHLYIHTGNSATRSDTGTYLPTGTDTIQFLGSDTRTFATGSSLGGPDGTIAVNGQSFVGTPTVVGAINWSGGYLAGPGTTATIAPTGVVTVTWYVEIPDTAALVNNGTLNVPNALSLCGNATLTNNATMNMANDGNYPQLRSCAPGDGNFVNSNGATLAADTSSGYHADVFTPFDNHGTVTTTATGTLYFYADNTPGGTDTGSYLPTGETINFYSGTRTFGPGAALGATTGTIDLTGTTFLGSPTITGALNWTGGQLAGPATTATITPTGTVEAANGVQIPDTAALVNNGTLNIPSVFYLCGNAALTNNATMNLVNSVGSPGFYVCGGGTPTFVNATGAHIVVDVSGGNAAYIYVPFDNHGSVTTTATGTLYVGSDSTPGGSDTGSYLPTGATISFNLGTRTFGPGAVLGAPSGTIDLTGTTFLGAPTITETLDWSGGKLAGPGTTATIAPTGVVNASNRFQIPDTAALVNNGTLNTPWGLDLCGNAALTNNGTMNLINSGGYPQFNVCGMGDPATFVNSSGATLAVDVSGGYYAVIDVPFDNHGTVTTTSTGVLYIHFVNTPGGTDTGAYNPTGETIAFNGGTRTFGVGSSFGSTGTVAITSGLYTTVPTITKTLHWTGGSITGPLTIAASGTLTLDSGSPRIRPASSLTNNGTVNWTGGTLNVCNDATFTNNATVNVSGSAAAANPGCGGVNAATLLNNTTGTFTATTGVTSISLFLRVTNKGTFTVTDSGSGQHLQVTNYVQTSGTTNLSTSTALLITGTTTAVFNGGTLQGVGTLQANATVDAATIGPGTAGTAGLLTINGTLTTSASTIWTIDITGQSTFDIVDVTGAATLAGTANVNFTYTPGGYPRDHDIVTFASLTDTFTTVNFTGVPVGHTATMSYPSGTSARATLT